MQNNKNLLLFMVLSMAILFGWSQFNLWLNPPKPKPKPEIETAQQVWPFGRLPRKEQERIVAQLSLAGLVSGGLDPVSRLADIALLSAHFPAPDPWPWSSKSRAVQGAALAQLTLAAPSLGALDGAARLASEVYLATKFPPVPQSVAQPERSDIVLGDGPDYFLKVRLSDRGAAVRQVTLNRFQGADWYGLPVYADKSDKKKTPLELVPQYRIRDRFELTEPPDHEIIYDDGRDGRPYHPLYHYTLYHYTSPEDERPVTTLADELWKPGEIKRDAEQQEVSFAAELPGQVRITKTYSLKPHDYHVGLSIKIEKLRPGPQKFRYQLKGARGLPIEGGWYTYTYRNAMVGWVDKKSYGYRDLETSHQIALWQGGNRHDRGDKAIHYAAVAVQFFAAAIAVAEKNHQPSGRDDFIEWARATQEGEAHKQMPFLDDLTVRLVTEPLALTDKPVEHAYMLYHGPVKVAQLGYLKGDDAVAPELVERYETALHLNTLTDYHSPGWMGEFGSTIGMTNLIIFFTNLMHWLLDKLHWLLPVYGLNIIMLTVLVRGLMFPVSRRQAMANQKMQEKMGKLAPEVKKLQEKYKDDVAGLNQARTQLYLDHGINPLSAMGGCFLIFAQMPVFLGLYYCLQESIFFRLDPFLWVRNLAAPDMMIWWSEKIPMLSEPSQLGGLLYLGPYFNLLPVIAVTLMLVQQQMMTPPPTDEQQEMQMKMMKYMMVFFGFMFYKVAAGLCIYFIASSIWGVSERKLLPKTKPASTDETPAARSGSRARAPRREADENGLGQKLKGWWHQVLKDADKQQQARRGDEPKKRRK